MLVQNTAELRSLNKKKIIEFLRFNVPSTKKDITEDLDLSFATVSNLCNQLIEEGILDIVSSQSSNGGRIPGLLSIKPCSKYSFCLDIIRRKEVKVAIVNMKNEVVASVVEKVTVSEDFKELVRFYYALYCRLLGEYEISRSDIIGVGVAVPGILNRSDNCVVNSTNPVFENKPLQKEIEKLFGLQASLENESNLMALATSFSDKDGSKKKDIIYLYLGEGLGTGILCNGNLVMGNKGLGGEISHMPLGDRRYECYCGNSGCIETELTQKGFLRKYSETAGIELEDTQENWEKFINHVLSGDVAAIQVVEENGKLLGKVIASLVGIFNPEAIFIGGITERIFNAIYPPMMEEALKRFIIKDQGELEIINSENYDNLIFKGVTELVFKNWNL